MATTNVGTRARRQARIVRQKKIGYRVEFKDPMPGDLVVVKLDKPNRNGDVYAEIVLGEKTDRNLFTARKEE